VTNSFTSPPKEKKLGPVASTLTNRLPRVIDGMITLRWTVEKQAVRIESGWNWFTIMANHWL
jgi:hypothetical protein